MKAIRIHCECKNCGNIMKKVIPFLLDNLRGLKPSCSCGNKTRFKLIDFDKVELTCDVPEFESAADESVQEFLNLKRTQSQKIIKDIIDEIEKELGSPVIITEIINRAVKKGIHQADVEFIIEKFRKNGDIFMPRAGAIQKL